MIESDDNLAHYGVKGMQWGVRRNAKQLARAQAKRDRSSEDRRASDDARTKAKSSGKESLSNKELQTVINRMNLEMSYSAIAGSPAQKVGSKFTQSFLNESGKKAGKSAATKAVGALTKS